MLELVRIAENHTEFVVVLSHQRRLNPITPRGENAYHQSMYIYILYITSYLGQTDPKCPNL